jgi:hypothetical protein
VPVSSAAMLSDPSAVAPTFTVDLPGTYVAQLIVNDGSVDGVPATVTISTLNSAPVAHAGPGQSVYVGDTVTLDGGASSDVDGDALSFFWSLSAVPVSSAAMLSDPSAVAPTFTVDLPGTYVAQLIVNDATVDGAPATVTVSTQGSAPVADAGVDQSAFVGDTLALDGSGSSDADGDPLTYAWSLLSVPAGSLAVLSNTHLVDPALIVDMPGTYVVQLIVNDGIVNSAPSTVLFAVTTLPSPGSFALSEIEWHSDDAQLEVQGLGEPGAQVVLLAFGMVPAKITVSGGGEWQLTIDVSRPPPCQLRGVSRGQFSELAVKNAPSDCQSGPPGH